MKIKYLFFSIVILLVLFSCKRNPLKVDISGIEKEVEIVQFGKELFAINGEDTLQEITNISNKYPDFFDLFTYKIIRIGGIGDEQFLDLMQKFVSDTMILNVKHLADVEFSDFQKIEKELILAFKYFQFHFPKRDLPTIYTYVSGFNQSVVTAENIVGISLDKYLGRDCDYYKKLNSTPQYKILNMHKGKIASDVVYAWGVTEFEATNTTSTLLDNMIYNGKLMYFVDALLPEMKDSLKIGYTEEQLKWCYNNEAQMWSQMIERKMLYTSKRMDIRRYINNSPTTSGFPLESPGRTGVWLGWQIIRQYMQIHPEITLHQLMENNDYQQILNDSEYFPE